MDNEFVHKRTWGPKPKYPLVEAYKPKTDKFIVVAGPCSVESMGHITMMASAVANCGATHLRGGLFRAGTYPGPSFGWVNEDLIAAHKMAANANEMKNIIEILDYSETSLEKVLPYADCVQIGARSMQNYTLLRKLGAMGKPVFLKRNPGATLDEWLGAAEHVLTAGCNEIYLIERGSSSFLDHVRWDLSISLIPAAKAITQIPIIVDASHGTGRRDLVHAMTLAGVAAGANGVLVEVHEEPINSLSDPDQAITPWEFKNLMIDVNTIRKIQRRL